MKVLHDIDALADVYDVLVIGAGPAGMSAAATAARLGLSAVLVDEGHSPGGQIYRSVTTTPVTDRAVLGADYWKGAELAASFAESGASYLPRATVWNLAPSANNEHGVEVWISCAGRSRTVRAREVVAATGALERPFPVPGWTLPGVMTAGAAQIALKSSGMVPQGRVVVAGCGPLLYLIVAQLKAAGADIVAVADTTPRSRMFRAVSLWPDFLASPYLLKGLRLLARARAGTRHIRNVGVLEAHGGDRLETVALRAGSRALDIECDTLLLHQGVAPNINLASAVGCDLEWDDVQLSWRPVLDTWLRSSVPGIVIAGDSGGIAGADSAACSGELAALGVAGRRGGIPAGELDLMAQPVRARRRAWMKGRQFLDVVYRPPHAFRVPGKAGTIVCRCEEVTAGEVRKAAADGAVPGPNQLKAFLRCGMGPCQGRMCSLTVTEMLAEIRGLPPARIGTYRQRPPFKPVTVAELASMPVSEDAIRAVVR